MLVQRRRRWTNIKPTLLQRLVSVVLSDQITALGNEMCFNITICKYLILNKTNIINVHPFDVVATHNFKWVKI